MEIPSEYLNIVTFLIGNQKKIPRGINDKIAREIAKSGLVTYES